MTSGSRGSGARARLGLDAHSAVGLVPLVEVARENGLEPEPLLRAAGIAPEVLVEPAAMVPDARLHSFVMLLLARTGNAALGLAAGRHYNLATFGMLGAVAAVTPSPRDVVRLFVQYQHLTFTFFLLELDEAGQQLLLVPDGDLGPLHRFYLDRDLSFVFCTARRLWPGTYRELVKELCFDYPEPREVAEYRAWFGAPVRFGAECAKVCIDFTAEPPPSAVNALGNEELRRQLQSFVAMAPATEDIVQRTRNAVMLAVGARRHLPTIDEIAERLDRSARTLRRELSARGTSFRDLSDDVVVTLAQRYLRDRSLSIAAVAERLGYAEPSSFMRAFRRITGRTVTSERE
jgi:AraC-like DNA-binding protein